MRAQRQINKLMWTIKWPYRFGVPFNDRWLGRSRTQIRDRFRRSFGCSPGTGDMKDVKIVRVRIIEEAQP